MTKCGTTLCAAYEKDNTTSLGLHHTNINHSINTYITMKKPTLVHLTGLSFSDALKRLKDGDIVSREGWNGKGMFLKHIKEGEWSMPNVSIVPDAVVPLSGFIGMKTADDKFVPWLASQTDILATDWCVVGFENT